MEMITRLHLHWQQKFWVLPISSERERERWNREWGENDEEEQIIRERELETEMEAKKQQGKWSEWLMRKGSVFIKPKGG